MESRNLKLREGCEVCGHMIVHELTLNIETHLHEVKCIECGKEFKVATDQIESESP